MFTGIKYNAIHPFIDSYHQNAAHHMSVMHVCIRNYELPSKTTGIQECTTTDFSFIALHLCFDRTVTGHLFNSDNVCLIMFQWRLTMVACIINNPIDQINPIFCLNSFAISESNVSETLRVHNQI